jgi:hypothetical protein
MLDTYDGEGDLDTEQPICECVLMLVMSLKELALEYDVALLPSYCDKFIVCGLDPINAPLVLRRSMRSGATHRSVFAMALRFVSEAAVFDAMQATPRFRALFERDERFRQLVMETVARRSTVQPRAPSQEAFW